MLETLFTQPTFLTRYRAAPFFDAREKFLEQCAVSGYSHSMLKIIAWVLMSLADSIDLKNDKVTMIEIERAVDSRARTKRSSKNTKDSKRTHKVFVHFATEWVRSLGRLAEFTDKESPFAAQISAFTQYLQDERGLSPETISSRCEHLAWFFKSLNPKQDSLNKISIADVDRYIAAKGKKGCKRSSLANLANSLRSFFRFVEGQGWYFPGIAAIIESPRLYAQEGIPEGPNWVDVQRLLVSTRGDRPADVRDHAILMLLAVYGLRRGEVARLKLDDLDWAGERITVTRSKQSRIQYFPLVLEVGEAILHYLREVRPRCVHRALFLTLNAPIRPLIAKTISRIVHARLSTLGLILPHRGPHCLRHACARHLLDSGFSLKQIGDHLGHRSANSTLNYTKIDLAGLREVAELDLRRLL
jgi:site-specific recombinase XerD